MENIDPIRDLTRNEIRDIRKLVTSMCAGYDCQHGCLILDCGCYMLTKRQTGYYCKYFSNAVLPLNPVLQKSLNNQVSGVHIKQCEICGEIIHINGNRTKYCKLCADRTHRIKKTESEQKRRHTVDK